MTATKEKQKTGYQHHFADLETYIEEKTSQSSKAGGKVSAIMDLVAWIVTNQRQTDKEDGEMEVYPLEGFRGEDNSK